MERRNCVHRPGFLLRQKDAALSEKPIAWNCGRGAIRHHHGPRGRPRGRKFDRKRHYAIERRRAGTEEGRFRARRHQVHRGHDSEALTLGRIPLSRGCKAAISPGVCRPGRTLLSAGLWRVCLAQNRKCSAGCDDRKRAATRALFLIRDGVVRNRHSCPATLPSQ